MVTPSGSGGESQKATGKSQQKKRSDLLDPKNTKRNAERDEIRQLFRHAKALERKGVWRQAVLVLEEILERDPNDSHSHLALAKLQARRSSSFVLGHHSKNAINASAAFERGVMACPDSIHLWQAWAVHETECGHGQRARDLYECALKLDPYNPYACHAYGLLEKRNFNNISGAHQLWERALQNHSTAALVCSLGELWISQGSYENARNLYVQHVLQLPTKREQVEVYLAFSWLEERYFRNLDRARELLQLALASDPSSSLARVALARLESRVMGGAFSGDSSQWLRHCTMRGSSKSQDGRVYNAWAKEEVQKRNYRKAQTILQDGLKQHPGDHTLLQAAGRVEELLKNSTAARDFYSASLAIQPAAPTLVAYALLELRHGTIDNNGVATEVNFTKVTRLLEEALLLDPRHGPAYNSYANALLWRGYIEQARRVYERGVAANCSDVASVYHGYAKLELSQGNIDVARRLLQQGRESCQALYVGMDYPHRERASFLIHTTGMLELNCDNALGAREIFLDGLSRYARNSSQLLLGAALAEVQLGNEDEARGYFESSVRANERHAQAWQAWGVMEMRAGNWATAQTLLQTGLKANPHHGALWLALATLEGRRGHAEVSRSLFAEGLRKAPQHIPLLQAWASLELRQGNLTAARLLISQSLTHGKSNGFGWLIAAEIERRSGNLGLVNLILRRGIECCSGKLPRSNHVTVDQSDVQALYKALGDSLLGGGKIGQAREIYERGLDLDPRGYAPLFHALAELEARVGNLDGLAQLHRRAKLAYDPNVRPSGRADHSFVRQQTRRGGTSAAAGSRVAPQVAALAQRIVLEEEEDAGTDAKADPDAVLESIMNANHILQVKGTHGILLLDDDVWNTGSNEENVAS